jgi:hypothetical protein
MDPSGPFSYVIKGNSTVEAQPVTVIEVEIGAALIGKGLEVGERVVVSDQTDLAPGITVAVRAATPGEMNAREPEIGPEGVSSTGVTPA